MSDDKLSLANEWLDVCAGCEMAVVGMHENILNILEKVDILYSPVLVDAKEIPKVDIGLVTGAIANEENLEQAEEMREKSDILIALGTCAVTGCVHGLSNLYTREEIMEGVYGEESTTVNPENLFPSEEVPDLTEYTEPLRNHINVDYEIPGCPPESDLLYDVLLDLVNGEEPDLPEETVCDECPFDNSGVKIEEISRLRIDKDVNEDGPCILSQGILCMGGATVAGCGAKCPDVNIPCTGCHGFYPGTSDQAGEIMRILSNELEFEDKYSNIEADKVGLDDWVGTFYMFSYASSLLRNRLRGE